MEQNKLKKIVEFSAGGFVINHGKLLLIKLLDNQKIGIPKGHIEKNEDPLAAARREIAEETGYQALKLIKELPKIEYTFREKDKLILKTVYLYLFELLDDMNCDPKREEHEEIENVWANYDQAEKIVSYDDIKKVLKTIKDII